jgi:hypothetical protein
MFNIDSIVRVIPYSYVGLFKTYNYVDNWNKTNVQEDDCVMLGGTYQVLEIEKEENGNLFYSLLPKGVNKRGWVFEKYLLLNEDVKNCSFNVGDNVVFDLSEEEVKHQSFPLWNKAYSFDDKSKVYKITEILNEFYIFLDYEKSDPNSAPFRWDNFRKV